MALFDGDTLIDSRDLIIGRGHAERLVPLIAELDDGGRAASILVGCGPGSFAGVRIGIAAARGLALAWDVPAFGCSSLALVAAAHHDALAAAGGALVVMEGGHGQWFVQPFDATLHAQAPVASLLPEMAIALDHRLVLGSRAEAFVALRGDGSALPAWPEARAAARLPVVDFTTPPQPHYGRAPDAKPAAKPAASSPGTA